MSKKLNIKLTKASAGSGKTYSLMNRISKLIEGVDGKTGIDPSAILATTFTVKAANELKERIRGKLIEMGRVEQSQKVSDALIGTVNGICGRLLAEYAVEAGLSPQLEVLDEVNAKVVFKQAVAPALQTRMEKIEKLAYRFGMLEEQCYSPSSGDDWWKSVLKMTDLARANGFVNVATGKADHEKFEQSRKLSVKAVDGMFSGSEDFSLEAAVELVRGQRSNLDQILRDEKAADTHKKFAEKCLLLLKETTWANALPSSLPKSHPLYAVYEKLSGGVMNSRQLKEEAKTLVDEMFEVAEECLNAYQAFKTRHGLIDFVDQEMRLLELFEGNERFRAAFKERVKVVMVDEFQDTSPMQLALFLKMDELVGNSIWVGDPKQSIYGFRGSDPVLMQTVSKEIEAADSANVSTLEYSWRSREKLVNFANAVFVESFKGTMTEKDVSLGLDWSAIDKQGLRAKREGGEIESWPVDVDAKMPPPFDDPGYEGMLAWGVCEYVKAHPDVPLSRIAVLTRTNPAAAEIASWLSMFGVKASAASGNLNEQPICRLAMAAFRFAVDSHDTIALATLAAYAVDDPEWFGKLVAGRAEEMMDDGRTRVVNRTLDEWMNAGGFAKITAAAKDKGTLTPLEQLDYVIGAFGLDEYAGRMSEPDRALRNLEALRALCARFMSGAKLGGYPVTHAGFVKYFIDSAEPEASCAGGDCVQVMTYHKSKGLEWSVVILAELNKGIKEGVFALSIVQAGEFDASNPLGGRMIRCMFSPFSTRTKAPFEKSETYQKILPEIAYGEIEEMKRLMYVGITRARDVLVLAPHAKSKKSGTEADAKWLDFLSEDKTSVEEHYKALFASINAGKKTKDTWPGKSMFTGCWKFEDSESDSWTIAGTQFSVKTHYLTTPSEQDADGVGASGHEADEMPVSEEMAWCDGTVENPPQYAAANVSPSAEEGKSIPVEVRSVVELGKWFALSKGDNESAALGEAMHNYYAVAVKGEDDVELARSLLERWGVAAVVTLEKLVETGANLRRYIKDRWPGCDISTEVPMSLRGEDGQLYQGYIDMLVKTAGGYVLIDHKTGLSRDYQKVAEKYAGQQVVYKRAIEAATARKVEKCVLHLPVCGVCVECAL